MMESNRWKAQVMGAVNELKACPVVEVTVWSEHGQEHFHPDVGEYWKPAHVDVSGDMNDPAVLKVLSAVMDKHGMKVHNHHGVKECGDDWARLVVDRSAGDD